MDRTFALSALFPKWSLKAILLIVTIVEKASTLMMLVKILNLNMEHK
jgi:hypothetical protein